MQRLRIVLVIAGCLILSGALAPAAPVARCQQLLQQLDTIQGPATILPPDSPVAVDELFIDCQQAALAHPEDPDHQYGYGRVLTLVQDHGAALTLFEQATAQGHAAARFQLGLAHLHGRGVTPDTRTAMDWFRQAAEDDHAPAAHYLARHYLIGDAVSSDPGMAVAWLSRAARQHYPPAQYALSLLYRSGHGVPRNGTEAMRWLTRAARQGLPDAQYALALEYFHGDMVDADFLKALDWLQRAADNGHKMAGRGFFADTLCERD